MFSCRPTAMKTAALSVAFAILCVFAEAQMGPGGMGHGRMGSGMMGSGRMGPPAWMSSGMMGPGMMGPGMMGPSEMGPDSGKPLIRCKRPMCEMMCAYGMRLDEQGCPTCECQADPCQVRVGYRGTSLLRSPAGWGKCGQNGEVTVFVGVI